ncbi:unnamed protein product, partial [marine sediment metagenome]
SKQIDYILNASKKQKITVDNEKKANPTHIEFFCSTLIKVINQTMLGNVLIYQEEQMTAEQLAKKVLHLWDEKWVAGKYEDKERRPKDWSYNNRFSNMKHLTG